MMNVTALLNKEVRKSGEPFKTDSEPPPALGLMASKQPAPKPFKVTPINLGCLEISIKSGRSNRIPEGPEHR